jgi:hypothetical protein
MDTEILIFAVECIPILYDKSHGLYKDRNGTNNDYREVRNH